jgi:uncharacterized Rmd1/YagE family protein
MKKLNKGGLTLSDKIEEILKNFRKKVYRKVIEFFEIISIVRKVPPEVSIEILANVLATHMLLVAKLAYELKENGMDKKQLEKIIDDTIRLSFERDFERVSNSPAVAESIKLSILELTNELEKAKKEQLH